MKNFLIDLVVAAVLMTAMAASYHFIGFEKTVITGLVLCYVGTMKHNGRD